MASLAYGALCLFVFAMPWERLISLSGIFIITRVTGMIAVALTLFAVLVSGRLRRWRAFHVFALAFVIWAGVSVMILHMKEVPGKFYTFVQLLLVAWMVWELATTRGRVMGLFSAYVCGAYVAAVETILLYRRAADELRRFSAGGSEWSISARSSAGCVGRTYQSLSSPLP